MNPQHWQHIEQVYHAAMERAQAERASFLDAACAGDDELRRDVEVLLAANDDASKFLAEGAMTIEAREQDIKRRPLPAGQHLGHYRIISELGAGGMGEVYLARDSKLDRQAAIKVLPLQFTQDAERLRRFVREAKAASALNHPNIITIYEIGEARTESGDTHFIAAEFIEGVTLRDRMREAIEPREAVEMAIQMAAALEAAHRAGIIHRDVKPENVMLRPDGLVKVLDFGLAKLTPVQANAFATDAETLTAEMKTTPGVILGTLRYMSPEQARGRPVDARTDIFSLGVVLHEMIAGRPLFAGETSADIIAAIIHKQPAPLAGEELNRIVAKALAKDAGERYQTVGELKRDLQTLRQEFEFQAQLARAGQPGPISDPISNPIPGPIPDLGDAPNTSQSRNSTAVSPALARKWMWPVIGAAALLVAGAMAWKLLTSSPAQPPRDLQFETLFGRKVRDSVSIPKGRFSANAKMIAFTSSGEDGLGDNIWFKQVSGEVERQITFGPWKETSPVWSPDDQQIAFISDRGNQLGIWRIPFSGGTPVLIKVLRGAEAVANRNRLRLVAWAKNEAAIYFEWDFALFRLDLDSKQSAASLPANPPFQMAQDFSLSPDEREVAFIAREGRQFDVWRMELGNGKARRVTNDSIVEQRPLWLGDGRLIFNAAREGRQQVLAIDVAGGPAALLPTSDHQCRLDDFSPRETRLLCYEERDESDVFAIALDGGAERQITSNLGLEFWASVSPDSTALLYQAIPGERVVWGPQKSLLLTRPATVAGSALRLATNAFEAQWSPNGERVAFLRMAGDQAELWTVQATGGEAVNLRAGHVRYSTYRYNPPFNRRQPSVWSWSPDSARIAYSASRDGIENIWTVGLDGAPPRQISTNSDAMVKFHRPVWSPDGRSLAYICEATQQPAAGKHPWSVWTATQETQSLLLQTEAVVRLLGWTAADRLIAATTENGMEGLSQPSTVKLLSLTVGAGSAQTLGALTESHLTSLHLSPQRRAIAFARTQNSRHDLWLAVLTGAAIGPPRKLTNNTDPTTFLSSIAWAPDGKNLYFDRQTRWSLLTLVDRLR